MNPFQRKLYPLASIAAGVCTLAVALPAAAVDLKTADGTWTFSIDGNVNVDYIYNACQSNPKPVGAVVSACLGTSSGNSVSNIDNGLLPAAFTFGVATTQDGIDMSAHLGLYPGITTNDGGSPNLQSTPSKGNTNTALGTASLDVRQVYMTFGNADMGTFTLGRQIGLFESDAILNDMTLLGVGVAGAGATANPSNTTLGSIGWGYIYTDWLAQIDYTTPAFSGATLTFGIYDPLNSIGDPGTPAGKPAPGVHAKLVWKGSYDDTKVYFSISGIEQQQKYNLTPTVLAPATSGSYQSTGADLFLKVDYQGFSAFASGYYGKGIGTTALFVIGSDGNGNGRDSYGYLVQATYKVDKVKFGVNYGSSRLSYANNADRLANPLLVSNNDKITGGVYYDLTKNLMLLGEVSWAEDYAHLNPTSNSNTAVTVNVGAFLAF